ncbi:MAG: hypothetical protein FJZ95_10985, partial [Chloroflexi bacterium]|nr:hypothetical protein [Chloroflexota bacterium]
MRRLIFFFVIAALLLGSVGHDLSVPPAQAQIAPTIVLTPNSGIAAITIVGSGFSQSVERKLPIYIVWDTIRVPTVPPSPIFTSSFTVIISVPTQTEPRWHTVTAISDWEKAS